MFLSAPASRYLRRQQLRRQVTAFQSLIAVNGDLTAGVVIPAGATFFASIDAALVAATEILTITGRDNIGLPIGGANHVHCIGTIGAGLTVEVLPALAGTVSLYVWDGSDTFHKIAEG
jgi:hypothetical protein